METLRELFIKLGLGVDAASFAEGLAWEHAIEAGAELIVEAFAEVPKFLGEAIEKTAAFAEDVEVLAQKTGFSTDAIQKFGYAATLSHSSVEDLRVGLGHLAREIEKAKDGGEESVKAFSKIGITMNDLRTKSPEDMFFLLSDRMVKTKDASKRMASAMDLLGRGGSSLIPTMMRGADGLKAMGIEADQFGVVMGEKSVHAASEFKESLEKAEQVMIGLEHELAGPLIEALAPVVSSILEWVKANRALISQKVKTFAEAVIVVAKALGTVILGLAKVMLVLVDHARLVAMVVGAALTTALLVNAEAVAFAVSWYIALGVQAVASALAAAWAWIAAAAPILLIAAALTIAALAAEDFYVFIKGGDSMLGHLLNTYGDRFSKFMYEWSQPRSTDSWLLRMLKAVYQVLSDISPYLDKWDHFQKSLSDSTAPLRRFLGTQNAFEKGDDSADQAQRVKTFQAIYGGGGTPTASAAAAQQGANYVHAPSMTAHVQIVQGPGQSAGAVADQVTSQMDDWWDTKMRQASPLAVPTP